MQIIGLSGYARTGKDVAAEALKVDGWERLAFADTLRNVLLAINPLVHIEENYESVEVASSEKPIKVYKTNYEVRVQDVIDWHGWDGYKSSEYSDEIRRLLQRLGTEAGRNILGQNVWIDATFNGLEQNGKYVVTDCRFPNEAKEIQRIGGKLIRIEREGVGPVNDHPSETSLDDYSFDAVIDNAGTIDEFSVNIRELVKALFS